MSSDEITAAATRLIAEAERTVPEVPWINVAVPKPDVLIVARAVLAGAQEAAQMRMALQAQMTESGHTGDCHARRNPYMDCSESCRLARAALARHGDGGAGEPPAAIEREAP